MKRILAITVLLALCAGLASAQFSRDSVIFGSPLAPVAYSVPGYAARTGGWTANVPLRSVTSTVSYVADSLYLFPMIMSSAWTVDSLRYEVTTTAAGASTIGIYQDTTATVASAVPYPTVRLAVGGRDTMGVAVKAVSLSADTAKVSFRPGIYWVAIATNASTAAFRSCSSSGTPNVIPVPVGMGSTSLASCYVKTRTYDQFLPARFPLGATVGGVSMPIVIMHIKSIP